jgi:hypothetical protein
MTPVLKYDQIARIGRTARSWAPASAVEQAVTEALKREWRDPQPSRIGVHKAIGQPQILRNSVRLENS